jgi:hypothetical protein
MAATIKPGTNVVEVEIRCDLDAMANVDQQQSVSLQVIYASSLFFIDSQKGEPQLFEIPQEILDAPGYTVDDLPNVSYSLFEDPYDDADGGYCERPFDDDTAIRVARVLSVARVLYHMLRDRYSGYSVLERMVMFFLAWTRPKTGTDLTGVIDITPFVKWIRSADQFAERNYDIVTAPITEGWW